MSTRPETRSGNELAGLIIILLGFALLMNSMGIVSFGPFIARYWLPGLFISIGAVILSKSRNNDGMVGGLFFIGIGILFLLNSLGVFFWSFRLRQLIVPGILIFIGLKLLTRRNRPRRPRLERMERVRHEERERSDTHTEGTTDSSDFIQATAILGGFHRKCMSQRFRGADLTAIMGGGKLDLRGAQIEGDEAVLDVFTLMGGMEIQVPRDWAVDQRFTPILGGYEDKTSPDGPATKRLAIHGTTIMGGVVVMN